MDSHQNIKNGYFCVIQLSLNFIIQKKKLNKKIFHLKDKI